MQIAESECAAIMGFQTRWLHSASTDVYTHEYVSRKFADVNILALRRYGKVRRLLFETRCRIKRENFNVWVSAVATTLVAAEIQLAVDCEEPQHTAVAAERADVLDQLRRDLRARRK